MGLYSAWRVTMTQLRKDGDEIVQICEPSQGEDKLACFAYVDNRPTLDHYARDESGKAL